MHTIFAEATARGKAGVSIIRVSGPEARQVCERVSGPAPAPGRVALRSFRTTGGDIIDRGLVVFFESPKSFTGEDVVEFHTHGSKAVVRAIEAEVQASGLARMADAGEFTQRALLNDRLDLAQVEGLGDLIDAETEAQRRQAINVFEGALSEQTNRWRVALLRAAGLLEASIDFVDEDVPVDVIPEVCSLISSLSHELRLEIAGCEVAERVRDGFEVAILGAPNAGKSTLLNALVGRDLAITSTVAGTTRDVIEARMDINGLPVTFLDTAGIRVSSDEVEKIGIDRAISRGVQADLRVLLITHDWVTPSKFEDTLDIVLTAKADLNGGNGISGLTGLGIDQLLERVEELLAPRVAQVRFATSARHRDGLLRAMTALDRAAELLYAGSDLELIAEHVRDAIRAMDSIVGRIDVETVLGEIFSRFCIGK